MPELFIHVGLHRTGTTFLQTLVFPNLKTVRYTWDNQLEYLTERLVSEGDASYDPSFYERALIPYVQDHRSLISNESLSGDPFHLYVNQTRIADRLAQLFPDASIILGIRSQETLLVSLHLIYTMQGGSLGLERFLGYQNGEFRDCIDICGRQINLSMFRYDHIAEMYASRFRGGVHFLAYEQLAQDMPGYLDNLCEIIGESPVPSVPNRRINPSYGNYQYRMARLLNPLFRSTMNPDGLLPRMYLPFRGKRSLRELLANRWVDSWFRKLPKNRIVMPEKLSRSIREYYSPSNTAFENKWKLGLDRWGYALDG